MLYWKKSAKFDAKNSFCAVFIHQNQIKLSSYSEICNVLKSATPMIGSEGGVPLLFIKRSDVGVALVFLRRAKI